MSNEFTAIFELYEESPEPFYFARCAELIGVGAKGKTIDEARAKLSEAIRLTLEERGAKGMEEIQIHVSPGFTRFHPKPPAKPLLCNHCAMNSPP